MESLQLKNISKRYGAVQAVAGASVAFSDGEIHAVIGENGAGKSTLLKIAAGIVPPDDGDVWIRGERLFPHTASEAIARKVGMVQQHFALIEPFTVLENAVLGREPTSALGKLDMARARAKLLQIFRELGFELDLDARTSNLGVGDRQRLEIARAMYRDAKILILDEPTAVFTPRECAALYALLRRIADDGAAVVVVTHKLDEVLRFADRVSVMRKGELVRTRPLARPASTENARPSSTEVKGELTREIMGDADIREPVRASKAAGETLLRVEEIAVPPRLMSATFELKRGEIVGLAGVEGNGQRELLLVLAGLLRANTGSVVASGRIAIVHEDRQREGLVLDASVADNLMLGEYASYTQFGCIQTSQLQRAANERLLAAQVVPANLDLLPRNLSGGNQQKIVVTRAIARLRTTIGCSPRQGHEAGGGGADVLVLSQPTRGVDIRAASAIYEAIASAAQNDNAAVLVISSDLDELRALSDRILVIAHGRIVCEFPRTASDEQLGAAMLGGGDAT